MTTIHDRKIKLTGKLKNIEYRNAFVSSSVDVGVAFQIRELRKKQGYTQKKLAFAANMKQERISALENPSNAPNITTLKKLANALDVGLVVRFVPIGELVEWHLKLSTESLKVPKFNEDPYIIKEVEEENTITDAKQYKQNILPATSDRVVNFDDYKVRDDSLVPDSTIMRKALIVL
ncbi:MAG: helix-turn-helix domain-containing protein [Proteobacteria bacterium]|nr:helix-turn-helix domain-containing protein [Pseudomonadota bacterium]